MAEKMAKTTTRKIWKIAAKNGGLQSVEKYN